jgi:putative glutamine amidotransferase
VRGAIDRAVPLLAICRGFQEMNVALGGSLHQRLQDLPGRLDHSTPLVAHEGVRHAKAHTVMVTQGGWLQRVARADRIAVNSLHDQGVDRLAPFLLTEGIAPDGTIEAFRSPRSYAVGVQWHPEYDYESDPVSRRIFEDFAQAVRAPGAVAAAAD